MRLVTYANQPHPGLDLLTQSCKLHNVFLHVLGLDGKQCGHGADFLAKLDAQASYLNEIAHLHPNELIVFVDAFDVVVVEASETIEKCANALLTTSGTKAIFAAERHESPIQDLPWEHRKTMTFLNSGCFAGKAQDLNKLLAPLERLKASYHTLDDQLFFQARYFEDPSAIALDYGCLLFACMNGAQAIPRAEGGAIMKHSLTMPCILHFQGFEKNVLPFVPQSLYSLATKIQRVKLPNASRDALELLGSHFPSLRSHAKLKHPFWRGILACLLLLLLLLLNLF